MILYRAPNLAEMVGVPEYFIEEIGLIQLVGHNVRMTLCGSSERADGRLIVPRCDIVGAAAEWPRNVLCVNRALAETMKAARKDVVIMRGLH